MLLPVGLLAVGTAVPYRGAPRALFGRWLLAPLARPTVQSRG